MRQRGGVLFLVIILSTIFMHAGKAQYVAVHSETLAAQDQLIKSLADEIEHSRALSEAEDADTSRPRFIVASQWPSRTMIACKCDTFPLPPAYPNPQAQLANLRGITHLLLDPKLATNAGLARNLAMLGGEIETVELQPGGVLLQVKNIDNAKAAK